MPNPDRTHREIKNPQMSARSLADYMAASDTKKRTIVRDAKYHAIARVIQHDEAKAIISKFMSSGSTHVEILSNKSAELRSRLTDTEFDRDLYDSNADYIDRFSEIYANIDFPSAEILPAGSSLSFDLEGTKITADLGFRLRRYTKTNKLKIGAAILRYAKGKALPLEVANWQSALLFGYFSEIGPEEGAEAEMKLCITLDGYVGKCHPAPTDSVRRFRRIQSACATIREWWPGIAPPKNAIL